MRHHLGLLWGFRLPLARALAMSLVTRLVANYVDGLRDPDATHWCLDKGKLQPWKAIFQKARLDSSIPRMRLQQWQVYCVRKKMEFKGKKLLALAVHAFAKLIRDGAWEKAAKAGITDEILSVILEVHSPFLRKLTLHDIWLSHGKGQESWPDFRSLFFFLTNKGLEQISRQLKHGSVFVIRHVAGRFLLRGCWSKADPEEGPRAQGVEDGRRHADGPAFVPEA